MLSNLKITLIALLVAAGAVAGAFFYGRSTGIDSGKQSRQQEVDQLNLRIVEMERADLARQEVARQRIASVNSQLERLGLENLDLRAQLKAKQDTVVTKWQTKIVPGVCGLSEDTTAMIRSVLQIHEDQR